MPYLQAVYFCRNIFCLTYKAKCQRTAVHFCFIIRLPMHFPCNYINYILWLSSVLVSNKQISVINKFYFASTVNTYNIYFRIIFIILENNRTWLLNQEKHWCRATMLWLATTLKILLLIEKYKFVITYCLISL